MVSEQKKKNMHIEKVKVQCVAIDKGYYGRKIIKDGEQFIYEGILKNGEFPRWVESIDKKFESEFSQLDESVQENFKSEVIDFKGSVAADNSSEVEELKAELAELKEMFKAVMAKKAPAKAKAKKVDSII